MKNKDYCLTTNQFVDPFNVQANTARRAFCVQGHYMGAVPRKLPNNRLLWSKADQMRILGQTDGQEAAAA